MIENVLFRWTTGDDIPRSTLAVASLQKFYPKSKYALLYNGKKFDDFVENIKNYDNIIDFENLMILNQKKEDWPFKFDVIGGAWWKWTPLSLNIEPIEIVIDNDLIFFRKPISIEDWVSSDFDMIAADDIEGTERNLNVGDFKKNLRGYDKVINVGLVGLKNDLWKNMFVRIANSIPMESQRSFHINEQGAANVAVSLLEKTNFKIKRIPISVFSWWPYISESTETCHFVSALKVELEKYHSFIREIIVNGIENYSEGCRYLKNVHSGKEQLTKEKYKSLCCKMPAPKNLPKNDLRRKWAI